MVYFPIYFYFYFSPCGEKEYTSLQKLNYVGFLSVKIYIHNYKKKEGELKLRVNLFSVDKKATSYIILCKDDLPGKNTIQGKDNTLIWRGKNGKGKKRSEMESKENGKKK